MSLRNGLRGRLSPRAWSLAAIVVAVLAVHLPQIVGLSDPSPTLAYSGLASSTTPPTIGAADTIDPNIGYSSQALGHRAVLDVLSGRAPWWNPYDGTGAPLTGEFESAALFPPTLLLVFANGQLWEHMLFEIIAGICTLGLLRRLGLGWWASLAGAIAFALNGTFAWFGHATVNPVAMLPMLLLGIELAHEATLQSRRGGWWLIAVAGSLSLYAGFPELAYIDGLLALLWVVWRLWAGPADRRRFALKLAAGVGAGLLLCAPIALAGGSFLTHADLGNHIGGAFGADRLGPKALPQLILPYVYGPIFTYDDPHGVLLGQWSVVGGYLTVSLLVFATLGLLTRGRRGLRLVLLIWIVLAFSRMYNQVPVLYKVLGVLPDMGNIAFFRYGNASLAMAVIVLAALGLDEVIQAPQRSRRLVWAGAGWIAVTLGALAIAHPLAKQLGPHYAHRYYLELAGAWAIGLVALAAGVALLVRNQTWRAALLTLIVAGDAFAMFAAPVLGTPRGGTVDLQPVHYLQRHLATQRFFTLGPLQPNYGSYWGISQLNNNDFLPKSEARYVRARLDQYVDPTLFVGNSGGGRNPFLPSPEQELIRNLAGYRAAGVAYVLAPVATPLPASATARGLTLVRRTPTTLIYHLSGAAPLFSSTGGGCRVTGHGYTSATVTCPRAGTVVYRETAFPGWSATVGGNHASITRFAGLFQSIRVPAGTHTVRFSYSPPAIAWGGVAFVVGLLWLVAGAWRRPLPRRAAGEDNVAAAAAAA